MVPLRDAQEAASHADPGDHEAVRPGPRRQRGAAPALPRPARVPHPSSPTARRPCHPEGGLSWAVPRLAHAIIGRSASYATQIAGGVPEQIIGARFAHVLERRSRCVMIAGRGRRARSADLYVGGPPRAGYVVASDPVVLSCRPCGVRDPRLDQVRPSRTADLAGLGRGQGVPAAGSARFSGWAQSSCLLTVTKIRQAIAAEAAATVGWRGPDRAAGHRGLPGRDSVSREGSLFIFSYARCMQGSVTVHIDAPAGRVWELVSDVTRIGEFSPETFEAEWLDGASRPRAGGAVPRSCAAERSGPGVLDDVHGAGRRPGA